MMSANDTRRALPRDVTVTRSNAAPANALHYSLWQNALPSLLTAVICLFFALLWWNRFLGVTNEGWHFFFAQQIVHGKIPYRDFYLFVPPLLQLEMAAIIKLFGTHLIATQIVGLIEICIFAVALYSWMARVFPPSDAFLASVLGLIILIGNRTEELNALHMSAAFHATLAGWVATLAVSHETVRPKYAFWGGLLTGLALLVKQTSGVAATLSLPVLLLLATSHFHGWKKAWQVIAAFVTGWAVPLILVGTWLARNAALADAVSDLFLRGPVSKGSPLQMLSRQGSFLASDAYLRRHAILGLLVFAGFLLLCRERLTSLGQIQSGENRLSQKAPSANSSIDARGLWILAGLVTLSILSGWALSYSLTFHLHPLITSLPQDTAAFLSESGSLVLFSLFFWRLLTRHLDRNQIQFFLLAGFSCALAFLSSLSWPTSVGMIVPSFVFVFATVLSGLRGIPAGRILRPVAVLLSLLCIAQLTWQKCASPFGWARWKEPGIHNATATMKYPELQGYHVSPETADFVTRVTDEIDAHSTSEQTIFVDPHIPIFYLLSHRQPELFGYVHFVDVAPDFVDRADAITIRNHPPAVIVLFEPTEESLRMGETYFRGGRRSAQRDLLDAISEIRPQYQFADTITTPVTGQTVQILALR